MIRPSSEIEYPASEQQLLNARRIREPILNDFRHSVKADKKNDDGDK